MDYFELDLDELLPKNVGVDIYDLFYLNDLKQRRITINDVITPVSVEQVINAIMQFNREDVGIPVEDRQPIIIYLSSNGGDVDAGFSLIDVIENSKTPVYTVNIGYWYSMGFLIGIAGHKRYATKNAKLMMHDGDMAIVNSSGKAQDIASFYQEVDAKRKNFVLLHSKINEEQYDDKSMHEWYMFAEDAKKYGFIDYIIGEDCDIDEVI